jgi:preprotein translocase subunit YajC
MGECFNSQSMILMLVLAAMMYLLMIRPQQKQEKARRAMLAAVQKNDRVVTTGGIHGTVASLSEREVVLKLDSEGKMRITVDRSAIGRVLRDEPRESDTGAGKGV